MKIIDTKIATDFAMSLSAMIRVWSVPESIPNPRPAMFGIGMTADKEGDRQAFEQASKREGFDLVILAFAPGREKKGPSKISIYEQAADGAFTVWPNCFPWAQSADGPCLLLADGKNVGFAYDGTCLVKVLNVPMDDMAQRIEAGRKLLRLMRQCVPANINSRRLR